MFHACYQKTYQSMTKFKDLTTCHDVFREMQSSSTLSTFNFVIVSVILSNPKVWMSIFMFVKSWLLKSRLMLSLILAKFCQFVMFLVKRQVSHL